MTPERMAEIHAASFTSPRPWRAEEFAALTEAQGVFLCLSADGFLWGRVIADEAELLTVAVALGAREGGQGRALVADFLHVAERRGAVRAYLDVAEDNAAALALYARAGFAEVGRRKGYYTRPSGPARDALLLHRAIP